VSQVSKTSSNSVTYLCLMQGNACGIWTLEVMFPPGYRVSNCDAGASLHVSQLATSHVSMCIQERHNPHLEFEIECNLMFKLLSWEAVLCIGIEVNRLLNICKAEI
jgi:hypothetical protein